MASVSVKIEPEEALSSGSEEDYGDDDFVASSPLLKTEPDEACSSSSTADFRNNDAKLAKLSSKLYYPLNYDCSCPVLDKCEYMKILFAEGLIYEGILDNLKRCFVFGCRSRFPVKWPKRKTNKSRKKKVQKGQALLKFPIGGDLDAWKKAMPIYKDTFDPKKDYVCALHFEEKFLIRETVEFVKGEEVETSEGTYVQNISRIRTLLPLYEWKLKPEAVPTIFDMPLFEETLERVGMPNMYHRVRKPPAKKVKLEENSDD